MLVFILYVCIFNSKSNYLPWYNSSRLIQMRSTRPSKANEYSELIYLAPLLPTKFDSNILADLL